MNREDVAMEVTFENLDILRKEVQAAKLLLSECDEIFIEEGISNIELRGYLSGKLSADEVIELLDPPAEQRNQCDGCQAGIPLVDGAHRMGRPGGYPDLMSCQKERYEHLEQAEGAHGELVPDDVFEAEFMTWWEEHGQYCRSGGGDYERTFAFQAWRHLYPKLMAARAALAQPSPASELERPEVVAWAVFADNGNVICWSQRRDHVSLITWENDGRKVVPLYAAPVAQAGQVPDHAAFLDWAEKVLNDEQERLSGEDHLMDSNDCIATLREAAAPAQGGSTNE